MGRAKKMSQYYGEVEFRWLFIVTTKVENKAGNSKNAKRKSGNSDKNINKISKRMEICRYVQDSQSLWS